MRGRPPNIRWSGFAVLTIGHSQFGQFDGAMTRPLGASLFNIRGQHGALRGQRLFNIAHISRKLPHIRRWANAFGPPLVNPVRRIAALDSGYSLDLPCSSDEFGRERLNPGLSNIAQ
jgi:hypothetical protein